MKKKQCKMFAVLRCTKNSIVRLSNAKFECSWIHVLRHCSDCCRAVMHSTIYSPATQLPLLGNCSLCNHSLYREMLVANTVREGKLSVIFFSCMAVPADVSAIWWCFKMASGFLLCFPSCALFLLPFIRHCSLKFALSVFAQLCRRRNGCLRAAP